MTVAELIKELTKIKDKNKQIKLIDYISTDIYADIFSDIKGVRLWSDFVLIDVKEID